MKTSKIVRAKFKIRRVRLAFGLTLMTLLFSVLIAGGILLLYGYKGVAEYASNGLGGRYFASFNNMLASMIYSEDKDVIADAQRIYEKEKAEKCIENDECEYEKNEYPFTEYEDGSKSVRINTSAGGQAIINKIKDINNYPESKLDELLSKYNYKQKLTFKNYITKDDGWLYSLIGGEKINDVVKAPGGDVLQMASYNITYSAGDIFEPYRFKNVDIKNDEIPIFITESHAEAIMKERGVEIAGSDYEKTITLREKMNGDNGRFEMCFRNSFSINHVSAAITVEKGKEPAFKMPSGECRGVISDDENLIKDDMQTVIKFRVVGIYEQRNIYDTVDEDDLLNNLFKSGLGFSYFVIDSENISNNAKRVANEVWGEPSGWRKYTIYKDSYIVEFNDPEDVERIISEKDCGALRGNVCTDERPFVIAKYGNSSVFLEKIKNRLILYSVIAIVVIFILLLVVMMNTINRVLCDSRKETAVLRAIGYTRGDIAKIYAHYALIYATIVGIVSFVIGNFAALLICAINRTSFNSLLMVKFGVFEDLDVPLYGFSALTLLCVFVVLFCGLLSTILPLYLNTRRHIARDLREE